MEIHDRYLVSKTIKEEISERQNVPGTVFHHVYKQKNKKSTDGSDLFGWNYQPLAKHIKIVISKQLLSAKLSIWSDGYTMHFMLLKH